MMINDNGGQVALEYMLIFAISLILLIVFTLPLTQESVENTLDVSDTLKVKSDLSKIAQAIQQVYGEGQGSKQSVNIDSRHAVKVTVTSSYVSSKIKLNDGSSKLVKVDCNSNMAKSDINLAEGKTIIVVEWPVESKKMRIYTKLF